MYCATPADAPIPGAFLPEYNCRPKPDGVTVKGSHSIAATVSLPKVNICLVPGVETAGLAVANGGATPGVNSNAPMSDAPVNACVLRGFPFMSVLIQDAGYALPFKDQHALSAIFGAMLFAFV